MVSQRELWLLLARHGGSVNRTIEPTARHGGTVNEDRTIEPRARHSGTVNRTIEPQRMEIAGTFDAGKEARLCTTCALIFLSSMTACPCQMLKNCQGHVLNSLSSRKLGMGKTRAALALNSQQLAEIAGTFDACSFQKRAGRSHWKLALNTCVALNELLC